MPPRRSTRSAKPAVEQPQPETSKTSSKRKRTQTIKEEEQEENISSSSSSRVQRTSIVVGTNPSSRVRASTRSKSSVKEVEKSEDQEDALAPPPVKKSRQTPDSEDEAPVSK